MGRRCPAEGRPSAVFAEGAYNTIFASLIRFLCTGGARGRKRIPSRKRTRRTRARVPSTAAGNSSDGAVHPVNARPARVERHGGRRVEGENGAALLDELLEMPGESLVIFPPKTRRRVSLEAAQVRGILRPAGFGNSSDEASRVCMRLRSHWRGQSARCRSGCAKRRAPMGIAEFVRRFEERFPRGDPPCPGSGYGLRESDEIALDVQPAPQHDAGVRVPEGKLRDWYRRMDTWATRY